MLSASSASFALWDSGSVVIGGVSVTGMATMSERPDHALPNVVHAAVTERIGTMVRVAPAEGGFTPGIKFLTETADGGFYFIKSAPSETWMANAYKREAEAHGWLPESATRSLLLFHLAVGAHQTLVFRGVRDRRPGASVWADDAEVECALRGLERTYTDIDAAAPSDLATSVSTFWPSRTFWRDCAAGSASAPDEVPEAYVRLFAGMEGRVVAVLSRSIWAQEVSHEDLRRDQFLIETDGTATVIDWSFVTRTPRIVDAVSLGVGVCAAGLNPEAVFSRQGPFSGYVSDDINAVLSALAGYFFQAARETEGKPPRLCEAQLIQGRACLAWLRTRVG